VLSPKSWQTNLPKCSNSKMFGSHRLYDSYSHLHMQTRCNNHPDAFKHVLHLFELIFDEHPITNELGPAKHPTGSLAGLSNKFTLFIPVSYLKCRVKLIPLPPPIWSSKLSYPLHPDRRKRTANFPRLTVRSLRMSDPIVGLTKALGPYSTLNLKLKSLIVDRVLQVRRVYMKAPR